MRALLRRLELQVDYSKIQPNPWSTDQIFFVSHTVSGMKKASLALQVLPL